MNKTVRIVARFAIVLALIVVAFSVDKLLSIPLPINIAVVVLTVMLAVCQLFDLKTAVFATTMFGVVSLVYAYIFPNLSSPAFMKPWVSVLPRVFIGFTCYGSFYGLRRLLGKSKNAFVSQILPRAVSGAVGVATNTVLVLGMMALTSNGDMMEALIGVIIGFSFWLEVAAGIVLVPLVSLAVSKPLAKIHI